MTPAWRQNKSFSSSLPLQLIWDSTSLGLLKDCPRKYQLAMVEGWGSKTQSAHLKFGILYHSALELYDHNTIEGMSHDDAVLASVAATLESSAEPDGSPWRTDIPEKNICTLLRAIVWYLDEHINDPAEVVVLENGKPAVELSFKFDSGLEYKDEPVLLSGHLDRVVRLSDQIYVQDRKTTKNAMTSFYWAGFSPDNQMTLYSIASRVVYSTPVQGVMVDAVQVGKTFARFGRNFAHRTLRQLEEWQHDFSIYFSQARSYAENEWWPMNEKSCFLCPFRPICTRDPDVRQNFLEGDYVRTIWDPSIER